MSVPLTQALGPMKSRAILMFLLLSAGGCSPSPEITAVCVTPIQASRLSAAELKALSHSKTSAAKRCKDSTVQCNYKVRRSPNGDILVKVDFISTDHSGQCAQIVGDYQLQVYNAAGVFKERPLGV